MKYFCCTVLCHTNTVKITRVVNLPLEFWTVGCRKLITWWPKEVVTWHKKVVMWFVWNGLPPFSLIHDFGDAFHYAKASGNFGRNSNGKVLFVFFEYSGSLLEVVHIFWPEYSDRNLPFHFWQTDSLPLLGNSEEEFEMTRAISIGWPSLLGKCHSIFLRYSHWSLTGQFDIMESTLENKTPAETFPKFPPV